MACNNYKEEMPIGEEYQEQVENLVFNGESVDPTSVTWYAKVVNTLDETDTGYQQIVSIDSTADTGRFSINSERAIIQAINEVESEAIESSLLGKVYLPNIDGRKVMGYVWLTIFVKGTTTGPQMAVHKRVTVTKSAIQST